MNLTVINNEFAKIQKLIIVVKALLEHDKDITKIFEKLHPSTAASILEFLNNQEREQAILSLEQNFDPEILNFLDPIIIEKISKLWDATEFAKILDQLEDNEIFKILENLEIEEQTEILKFLNIENQKFIKESLAYPEDSVGRIMDNQFIAINENAKVREAKNFISNNSDLIDDAIEIYLINTKFQPLYKLDLAALFKHKDEILLKDISSEIEVCFDIEAKPKDVVFAFKNYKEKSIPIVSKKKGKLIGIVKITEIIDLIYSFSEEEFLHSGGIQDSDFYSNLFQTSYARLKWLSFSTIGSVLIAFLIDEFRDIIQKKSELTALQTIISSITAVSAIQVVTVNIRAIADRKLTSLNMKSILWKEFCVSLINSAILGLIIGIIFGFKNGDFSFFFLITFSLIFSMNWGAISGTILPILFNKIKVDPALSSGTFLSVAIDAFSAFIFFSIAKLIFL